MLPVHFLKGLGIRMTLFSAVRQNVGCFVIMIVLASLSRSPNHYARQRTMVVMETVRAATLASQRKKDRFSTELARSSPLAASSPSEKDKKSGIACSDIRPPSPILFSNSGNLPEEVVRYRNQTYVAPEKLQIVKPLEGSVTLLKWKLLASPQLGGATSYFSEAAQPGVHRKRWKAGRVIDDGQSAQNHNISCPPFLVESANKTSGVGLSVSMDPLQNLRPVSKGDSKKTSGSVLSQVGSFLGSGLSHLGLGVSKNNSLESHVSTQGTDGAGLSALLDS